MLIYLFAAYLLVSLLIAILNTEASTNYSSLTGNFTTYQNINNRTGSNAPLNQHSSLLDDNSTGLLENNTGNASNTSDDTRGIDNQMCVDYDNRSRTINLCGGIVNLSVLNRILNNSDVLNQTSKREWLLNSNIIIASGATLLINSGDTASLKINSTGAPAYHIMVEGNLLIDKTRISSWTAAAATTTATTTPTTNATNAIINSNTAAAGSNILAEVQRLPRGYLFVPANSTGQMNITNSNISDLGFASAKDTWGISYYSGTGSKIENNTIYSNLRGIHLASNASNITIANNTIRESLQYGLNLYGAKNITISGNEISNNSQDGIICSQLCGDILVQSNLISNNGRNGIMLSNQSSNSSLDNNSIFDNKRSGIGIYNSHNNTIVNNNIRDNVIGLTIAQASYSNSVNKNLIAGSLENGLIVRENSKENYIVNNAINNSKGIGIQVKDSRNNLLVKNNVTGNSDTGLLFSNASKNIMEGNDVYDNQRYNYYSKTNSTYNILRDTFFDNETLRFFDSSNSIVLQNTDNRVIQNNKKIPVSAYPRNTTLMLNPITKNVVVNSTDMFVTPLSGYVNISSLSKDFTSNMESKKWIQTSLPSSSSSASASSPQAATGYVIGKFSPNTQIMVKVNGSFWNSYTANDSGHITFIYDNLPSINSISKFEADINNSAAIATLVLFTIIAIGAAAVIILTSRLRKNKKPRKQEKINEQQQTTGQKIK